MVYVWMVSILTNANVKKIILVTIVKPVSLLFNAVDYVFILILFYAVHIILQQYLKLNCFILGINECDKMPCLNGGKCVDLGDVKLGDHYYKCVCQPGFTGKNCETNINECDPSPCLNGGNCVDGINDYTCKCPAGYTGKDCETSKFKTEINGIELLKNFTDMHEVLGMKRLCH